MPTTLLAVGHGSWIVATVAVLLDMDPDDLNNLGAMRNAFWTRMSVDARRGPAEPDTWQWKLDAFNQGPAIAALTDWENGPKELRAPEHAVVEAHHPVTCGNPRWAIAHRGRMR